MIKAFGHDALTACARYSAAGGLLVDRKIYIRRKPENPFNHYDVYPGKVSETFPTSETMFLVTDEA